jgi:Zn-dependent protease
MLVQMAELSLRLCFFNLLLPIPPLDGSRILRVLIGMSMETYARLCMFGPFLLIAVWQIPVVSQTIVKATDFTLLLILKGLNFPIELG